MATACFAILLLWPSWCKSNHIDLFFLLPPSSQHPQSQLTFHLPWSSRISPLTGANLNFHPIASPWRQCPWRCQPCWSLTHSFQNQTLLFLVAKFCLNHCFFCCDTIGLVRFHKLFHGAVKAFHVSASRTCKGTSKLNRGHTNPSCERKNLAQHDKHSQTN